MRLHVSGLGLEPRWLLNRLQTTFIMTDMFYPFTYWYDFWDQSSRIWKRGMMRKKWQQLRLSRWIRRLFWGNAPKRFVFFGSVSQVSISCPIEGQRNISQRLGSCLSPSFLLWWPTQSSPLSSTTMMADFILIVSEQWIKITWKVRIVNRVQQIV